MARNSSRNNAQMTVNVLAPAAVGQLTINVLNKPARLQLTDIAVVDERVEFDRIEARIGFSKKLRYAA